MKSLKLSVVAGLALSLIVSAGAFAKLEKTDKNFKMIDATTLHGWMNAKKKENVVVFDANGEDTRKSEGIIPGAKLLPTDKDYDAKTEFTAAKTAKMVFYCANTKCTASHMAAAKAAAAGYTHVFVMSDGIEGWKKAGFPSETVKE